MLFVDILEKMPTGTPKQQRDKQIVELSHTPGQKMLERDIKKALGLEQTTSLISTVRKTGVYRAGRNYRESLKRFYIEQPQDIAGQIRQARQELARLTNQEVALQKKVDALNEK